jgi:hypothetical protein
MNPQELADEVAAVVKRAQDRVGPGSIGAQQYHVEGQPQTFERMELDALLEYAIEETLDLINYGVMLTIRLDRMRESLKDLT